MIEAFSAVSTKKNGFDAGKEAAETAMAQLTGKPDIIWVFGAGSYNQQELLSGINSAADGIPVVGCTTSGEISSACLTTDSVVVLPMRSDTIRFHTASVTNVSRDSFAAGVKLGEKFKNLNYRYLQLFSDGLTGDATDIIEGVKQVLGKDVPISGGTAGDSGDFVKTYQYDGDQLLTDALVGVAFEGDFSFGTGVGHGWFPVGIAKQVTKAASNVVYELDGQPALKVYEKFLGHHASMLPAVGVEYPLGLLGVQEKSDEDDYFLCRATMGVDRAKGSITFAGAVPQGSYVKMTMGNEPDIIRAAQKATEGALQNIKSQNASAQPKVIFMYSCMARKMVLGSKTEQEINLIRELVGKDVPIIGFYTYGEYAPVGKAQESHFHNETIALTIVGE